MATISTRAATETGNSCAPKGKLQLARNSLYQTTCVMYHKLKTRPQYVRSTALSASPNPLGAMKIANVSAVAMILHRTQAERASDSPTHAVSNSPNQP